MKLIYEAPEVQVINMEVQASVMQISRGDGYGEETVWPDKEG